LAKESEYRAYSIASSAKEHKKIELFIAKTPGGIVSTYVHDYLKEGEKILMRGPYGDFYFKTSNKEILLIGTGSGLAPLMSILRHFETEKIKNKVRLFFGSRTQEDLYCQKKITKLERELYNFRFTPVLSRVGDDPTWKGEKGRVTTLIEKYVPENADLDVYICGNSKMVETCIDLLKKKGIPETQVFFDMF